MSTRTGTKALQEMLKETSTDRQHKETSRDVPDDHTFLQGHPALLANHHTRLGSAN